MGPDGQDRARLVCVTRADNTLSTIDLPSDIQPSQVVGRGAVLVVERLLSDARQRGVCKE